MLISLITAIADNNVIGYKNKLPWHLSADLKYFKKTTMGKPLIMGRKTHESIGKALPGRLNIIITRESDFTAQDCVIAHSEIEALEFADSVEEVIVIGGQSIYELFMPLAKRIYLTEVHAHIEGDTYFPEFDRNEWHETARQDNIRDQNNDHDYSFVILEKQ